MIKLKKSKSKHSFPSLQISTLHHKIEQKKGKKKKKPGFVSLGRGTQGHEPEGVPEPQENTQVQEPPRNANKLSIFLIISWLLSHLVEKKHFHGEHGNI
jgi:hypothetical protein